MATFDYAEAGILNEEGLFEEVPRLVLLSRPFLRLPHSVSGGVARLGPALVAK